MDDYLKLCDELGCEPDKPASGSFNVRIGQDVHTSATRAAARKGVSLNEFVKSAVLDALAGGTANSKQRHSKATH